MADVSRTPDEQWQITVRVPASLPSALRDDLFAAVADNVAAWEPDERDGWDADVSAGPVASRVSVSHITEDMVRPGISALSEVFPALDLLGTERYELAVRAVLSAALAGCTVAKPAEPTGNGVNGELYWWTALSSITVGLNLADKPFVRINGEFLDIDEVEADALAQLAAAREARRLAGGSQVGDQQHG